MIRKLKVLAFAMFLALGLFAGIGRAQGLDTAAVGQPYPYYYPYGGYYGGVGPYPYPNGYVGGGLESPNPSLNPGYSNPFFLSTMTGRATGINPRQAQDAAGFILYGPVPGEFYPY